MQMVRLGRTNITVCKNGFGALPIQRVSEETAAKILRKAYDSGIRFFDTAHVYSDSEKKIGLALSDVRENLYLATKAMCKTPEDFWTQLQQSLDTMKTDYIDVYQFHCASQVYRPGDGTGMYEAMLEAKAQGKIRFIGITAHNPNIALEAAESGLYDTVQFPFSYLSGDIDLKIVEACRKNDVGFIAMKGLSGGLLTRSDMCYAFMSQFDNVLPIWGIQRESELDEFLSYNDNPPALDDEMKALIEADKKELAGDFCRACGYCMPCTVGIKIPTAGRMIQLIRRSPSANHLSPESQEMMMNIENCVDCGVCMTRCPYQLPITTLLRKNLEDYKKILAGEASID